MSSPVRMTWRGPALAIALIVGCSSPTDPGIQQVNNVTDNFQYQVSNVKNFTGTRVYTWQLDRHQGQREPGDHRDGGNYHARDS